MTELPDEVIEAFFLGDTDGAWEQDEALASLAGEVLIGATGPAPKPSGALLAFLGEPDSVPARALKAAPLAQADTAPAGPAPLARETNVVPLFRRLRLTVGIAAAAGVAAAALAVTGTTGALPDPVMQAVSWVVEAVTPFEVGDRSPTVAGGDQVPRQGPISTVPAGAPDTGVGTGTAGPGGAPGQPPAIAPAVGPGAPGQPPATIPAPASGRPGAAGPSSGGTPPASIPAGVPGPAQPPFAVDQGGQSPPAPLIPVVPGPPGGSAPPAGGGSATPSTTSVGRADQAPAPATVPGAANRR